MTTVTAAPAITDPVAAAIAEAHARFLAWPAATIRETRARLGEAADRLDDCLDRIEAGDWLATPEETETIRRAAAGARGVQMLPIRDAVKEAGLPFKSRAQEGVRALWYLQGRYAADLRGLAPGRGLVLDGFSNALRPVTRPRPGELAPDGQSWRTEDDRAAATSEWWREQRRSWRR